MSINNTTEAAGEVCEPCKNRRSLCLVHVEIIEKQNDKKYLWKDGRGPLDCPGAQIALMTTKDNKVINVDLKIKASKCLNPKKHKDCTTFYFYEAAHNGKVIKNIEKKGQSSIIALRFNEEYLSSNSTLVPFYIDTNKDMKIININHKYGTLSGKEGKGPQTLLEKAKDKPLAIYNVVKNPFKYFKNDAIGDAVAAQGWSIGKFKGFMLRSTAFMAMGKPMGFPASKFHIAAMECGFQEKMLLDDNNIKTYHQFDSAVADIFVLPNYSTVIGLDITPPKITKVSDFLSVIPKTQISISLKETIGGTLNNEIKLNINGVRQLVREGYLAMMTNVTPLMVALDFFDKIYGLEKFIPKPISKLPNGHTLVEPIIGLSGTLPTIKMTGSKASSSVEAGKLKIKREHCKLDLTCGFEIYLNLMQSLINAVPLLNGAYKTAKGFLTSLSIIGIDGNISTDKNSIQRPASKKEGESQEAFAQRQKDTLKVVSERKTTAWAAASLVIYADLGFELKNATKISFNTDLWGWVPTPTCDGNKTEFIPSFSAGASFKARVFMFTGALGADFKIYSKLVLEFMKTKVDEGTDKEREEWGYYLAFMGLGISWSVSGSIGVEVGTKNEDGKRQTTKVGSLDTKSSTNKQGIDINKSTNNSSYQGTEWDEFEKRDQQITRLDQEIKILESEISKMDRNDAYVPIDLGWVDFKIEWQTGKLKDKIKPYRIKLKEKMKEKKSYEDLQKKSDTTKIFGGSILTYSNLSAKDLTKVNADINQRNH